MPSRPRQYEFARLNLTHTVLSKRVLTELVRSGHVSGWDDPRMPTLAGLRRRGVPPKAIRDFIKAIGVARADNLVDVAMLDHAIRDVLNRDGAAAHGGAAAAEGRRSRIIRKGRSRSSRRSTIPQDPAAGSRTVKFGREIYIERDDFMENPPKKFFRLSPGQEVRLRYAYFVTCREVVKDAAGEVVELRCTYDPADARRQHAARRAQGEGDAALGRGGGRRAGRSPAGQPAVPERRRPTSRISPPTSIRIRSRC